MGPACGHPPFAAAAPSTTGSISFGIDVVAGNGRVTSPLPPR
jgi:hypothetical protein